MVGGSTRSGGGVMSYYPRPVSGELRGDKIIEVPLVDVLPIVSIISSK